MNPHMGAGSLRRIEVVEVDDTGEIQKVTVRGLADEYFEFPLRGQPAGLTGNPVEGAVGYVLMADGNPDSAFLLNLENPKKRPTDLKGGESKFYGDAGQSVYAKENGDIDISSPTGIVHINP